MNKIISSKPLGKIDLEMRAQGKDYLNQPLARLLGRRRIQNTFLISMTTVKMSLELARAKSYKHIATKLKEFQKGYHTCRVLVELKNIIKDTVQIKNKN